MNALVISALASLSEAIGAKLEQVGKNEIKISFAEGGYVTIKGDWYGRASFYNHGGSMEKAYKTTALFALIVEHCEKFDIEKNLPRIIRADVDDMMESAREDETELIRVATEALAKVQL